MGISVADNFSYLGGKPLDGRIQYATLAAMKAMADATLYEGCEAYCVATDKYYKWKSTNTVDADTGKWREVESGGGSGLPSGGTQGQYLVKQSSTEGDADWQTLSAFGGATSQNAGSAGLVPAPSAGDEGKVLFGNGAWGNIVMPSVDYSILGNEAFIFSTTEKVIGQWTDGKLLYAKTVSTSNITRPVTSIAHNLTNFESKIILTYIYFSDGTCDHGVSNWGSQGDISAVSNAFATATDVKYQFKTSMGAASSLTAVIFYTKTTDSPLSSDEKFAGLLSNGTVVYKKTVSTGGSAPSGTTLIYRLALLNSTDIVYFTR